MLHLTIRITSGYSEFIDRNKSTNNATQPSSPFYVSVQNKQNRTACTLQVLHSITFCTLGGHKPNLVRTTSQEKGAMTPQVTQTGLWVPRSLRQRRGLVVASCRAGAPRAAVHALHGGPSEGGRRDLHHLHHSLVSGETTGREHAPTHLQKLGLKSYWAWPHPSEQDPVSPSASLSHQEASISLLSFSIRGQTDWKPQSQKTNQIDHVDHSLV